jgi:hypothetical protein
MVVAVPLMRMVQVPLDDVVSMTAVRYRFMSASSPVRVLTIVCSAGMA